MSCAAGPQAASGWQQRAGVPRRTQPQSCQNSPQPQTQATTASFPRERIMWVASPAVGAAQMLPLWGGPERPPPQQASSSTSLHSAAQPRTEAGAPFAWRRIPGNHSAHTHSQTQTQLHSSPQQTRGRKLPPQIRQGRQQRSRHALAKDEMHVGMHDTTLPVTGPARAGACSAALGGQHTRSMQGDTSDRQGQGNATQAKGSRGAGARTCGGPGLVPCPGQRAAVATRRQHAHAIWPTHAFTHHMAWQNPDRGAAGAGRHDGGRRAGAHRYVPSGPPRSALLHQGVQHQVVLDASPVSGTKPQATQRQHCLWAAFRRGSARGPHSCQGLIARRALHEAAPAAAVTEALENLGYDAHDDTCTMVYGTLMLAAAKPHQRQPAA